MVNRILCSFYHAECSVAYKCMPAQLARSRVKSPSHAMRLFLHYTPLHIGFGALKMIPWRASSNYAMLGPFLWPALSRYDTHWNVKQVQSYSHVCSIQDVVYWASGVFKSWNPCGLLRHNKDGEMVLWLSQQAFLTWPYDALYVHKGQCSFLLWFSRNGKRDRVFKKRQKR